MALLSAVHLWAGSRIGKQECVGECDLQKWMTPGLALEGRQNPDLSFSSAV